MANKHRVKHIDRLRSIQRYWIGRFLPEIPVSPLRIALLYSFFGFGALFLSDVLFVRYFSEPFLSQIQAVKGGVEVVLTAGLIFVLTRRLKEQLQQNIQHVDHQREELDVLHRILRHNLRNDLSLIYGYTEKIHRSISTAPFPEMCTEILSTADRITAYVEDASRINRLTSNGDRRQKYDIAANLPTLLAEHRRKTDDVETHATLPEEATVEVNPLFEEALQEILANAIEHNDSETPLIEVTVQSEGRPSHLVEICITDNGPGIPDAELKPLEVGREEQLVHLSGLGLWFIKWTIEYSEGELDFVDNEYGGTTVRIRVPKSPEMAIRSLKNWNRFY